MKARCLQFLLDLVHDLFQSSLAIGVQDRQTVDGFFERKRDSSQDVLHVVLDVDVFWGKAEDALAVGSVATILCWRGKDFRAIGSFDLYLNNLTGVRELAVDRGHFVHLVVSHWLRHSFNEDVHVEHNRPIIHQLEPLDEVVSLQGPSELGWRLSGVQILLILLCPRLFLESALVVCDVVIRAACKACGNEARQKNSNEFHIHSGECLGLGAVAFELVGCELVWQLAGFPERVIDHFAFRIVLLDPAVELGFQSGHALGFAELLEHLVVLGQGHHDLQIGVDFMAGVVDFLELLVAENPGFCFFDTSVYEPGDASHDKAEDENPKEDFLEEGDSLVDFRVVAHVVSFY